MGKECQEAQEGSQQYLNGDDDVDICFISDDNFASKLGVCLMSLFDFNDGNKITIHLINSGISEKNILLLKKLCQSAGSELVIYNPTSIIQKLKSLEFTAPVENNSIATLVRLFLPYIIPDSVHEIIYMDCDLLIRSDITSLYKAQFLEAAAGVIDANYDFYFKLRENYDYTRYINAGMLVINLPKYKERIRPDDVISILNTHPYFADQDVINTLLKDDITILPPKYNATVKYRLADPKHLRNWVHWKKNVVYTNFELQEAHQTPSIIHFTASLLGRPWEKSCIDPSTKLWRDYYDRSLWKDEPLQNKELSGSNRLGRLIYKKMPLSVYCSIDYNFAKRKFVKQMERK